MIVRDNNGIICQHYKDDTPIDGGDSASRTGIMATCGSERDMSLLKWFFVFSDKFKYAEIVRHPFQEKWNNPKLTSRDQLVCFASGCYYCFDLTSTMWIKSILRKYKFNINSDILAPDVKLHLHLCARSMPWWAPIGYAYLRLAILWACFVRPDDELNQILCQCLVAGRQYVRMLTKLHPDWKKNVMDYWGGWRDQKEIGEALIEKVMKNI